VGWNAVSALAATLHAKQARRLGCVSKLDWRQRGVNAHGRTIFQCVIVLNISVIVNGVFCSLVLLASSSASRFRSSVFSSGLRKVECSGRGTMRKNEAIARRTVKSPSIKKTLSMSIYLS